MLRSIAFRAPLTRLPPSATTSRAALAGRSAIPTLPSASPLPARSPRLSLAPSQRCFLVPASAFSTSSARDAPFQFKLFDVGEGITEVEVLKWDVQPGQRVEEFDALCEVQSDKSSSVSPPITSLLAWDEPGYGRWERQLT